MTFHWYNILIVIAFFALLQTVHAEGFTNLPLSEHEGYNWYSVASNTSPAVQIWNATCERVGVKRTEWRTPPPTLSQSFWVGIADTNLVVTNITGSVTNIYTNVFTVVSNVLRNVYPALYPRLDYFATNYNATNNIGAFEYVYMDDTNLITNTAYPNLDYSLIWFMGQSLFSGNGQISSDLSVRSYAVMNLYSNGSFNNYFSRTANDGSYPDSFPLQSKAGLFYRAGIGCTFGRTTNDWGVVTGGRGYMTRQPLMDDVWWLNESHLPTAGATTWSKDFSATFSQGHTNESQLPLLFYTPGSTTTTDSFDVVLSGQALLLNPNNTAPCTVFSTNETVTINNRSVTQEVVLSNRWYSFTSITNSATNLTADSTINIRYEDEMIIFDINQSGGPSDYRLYQVNLDEFYHALTNMIASESDGWDTKETETGGSVTQGIYQWQGWSWSEAASNKTTYATNLPGTVYAWAATTPVVPDFVIEPTIGDEITVTNDSSTKPNWRYKVDIVTTGTITVTTAPGTAGVVAVSITLRNNTSDDYYTNNIAMGSPAIVVTNYTITNSEYIVTAAGAGINQLTWDATYGRISGSGQIGISKSARASKVSFIGAEILAERAIANIIPVIDPYSQYYWTNRTTGRELYLQGAVYPTQEHFQALTPLVLSNFEWSAETSIADLVTNKYVKIWSVAETLGSTGGICNAGATNTFSVIPFYNQTDFEERGWWVSSENNPLWLIRHDIVGTNRGFDFW